MSDWINYIARGIGLTSIGFTLLILFNVLTQTAASQDLGSLAVLLGIPAAILAAMLWTAWGSPLWGGFGFVFLGLLPSTILGGEDSVNFALAAPLLITGVLFIAVYVLERFNDDPN